MSSVRNAPLEIIEKVVIAGGPEKRHRSRAGLQLLPSGELYVAYRIGWSMFDIPHGGVVGTWSKDGGHTWEEPQPLIAEPGWDWFGALRLLQLTDGTLLMLLGKTRWGTGHFFTFATLSRDGGRSWEEMGQDIKVYGDWSEPYGSGITQGLSDGRLMMGFQGAHEKDTASMVGVAYSSDEGKTWSDLVIVASDPELYFRETELLRLRDGRILAAIRTDKPPYQSYQSYSADEGRTWTPIKKMGFKGHCLRLFQLNGAVACFIREMEPDRPGIAYNVSYDDGETWRHGGQLYHATGAYSGWAEACGYPDVVRLLDGDLFCIYHTRFVDGDSEVRGLFLRDQT